MFNDEIQDLLQAIELLPKNLEDKVRYWVFKALFYAEKLAGLPASWAEPIANMVGHNVVKVFKIAGRDSKAVRVAVVKRLIQIFDLDPDWKPNFSLDPETEATPA